MLYLSTFLSIWDENNGNYAYMMNFKMRIKYPLSNRQNTEKCMNNDDNNNQREEVCGPPILTLGLGVA